MSDLESEVETNANPVVLAQLGEQGVPVSAPPKFFASVVYVVGSITIEKSDPEALGTNVYATSVLVVFVEVYAIDKMSK